MRSILSFAAGCLVLGAAAAAQAPAPQATAPSQPAQQAVGSMSELMVQLLRPTSDAVFYITTRTPATDAEWLELQAKTLTLAESANLLMMPARARGRDQWMQDAGLLLDAGRAAFEAVRAKDVARLEALNDQLYRSCVACHEHFRPGYGRRP
jgi:hypothetical protein